MPHPTAALVPDITELTAVTAGTECGVFLLNTVMHGAPSTGSHIRLHSLSLWMGPCLSLGSMQWGAELPTRVWARCIPGCQAQPLQWKGIILVPHLADLRLS